MATHAAAAAGVIKLGDRPVARLGFGAMRITGPGIWGEPENPGTARAVLRKAVELGVNFIDTADAYGPDVSERLIAAALHPYPSDLVIGTKGGIVRAGADKWGRDARPSHLRSACEASLRRLKTHCIDLYQLHAIDPEVPLEDSVGEIAKLQREGKVRHVGVSNFSVQELERASRLITIVSVQNRYHVTDRSSDDVIRWCVRKNVAFIPWGPLARRALAEGGDPRVEALESIAKERRVSSAQVALAWQLARAPIMLPIPGTASLDHLADNVAAASLRLSTAELSRIG